MNRLILFQAQVAQSSLVRGLDLCGPGKVILVLILVMMRKNLLHSTGLTLHQMAERLVLTSSDSHRVGSSFHRLAFDDEFNTIRIGLIVGAKYWRWVTRIWKGELSDSRFFSLNRLSWSR